MKLAPHVSFLGKQNQVQDLLRCGDTFLLPSDLESFGLAALEAMAYSTRDVVETIAGEKRCRIGVGLHVHQGDLGARG